jgi:integrase
MKTMIKSNGEGNRSIVRNDVGIDSNTGKRKQIQKVVKTAKEAIACMEQMKLKGSGIEFPISMDMNSNNDKNENLVDVTLGDFVGDWFYGEYRGHVTPRTFKSSRIYVEKQIVPNFGNMIMSEINKHHIDSFYQGLKEEYPHSTIIKIHGVLSRIFREALNRGHIKLIPVAVTRLPRNQDVQMQSILSKDEITRLLKVAEQEKVDTLYSFALFTGTRLSELLILTWSDIDLENKTVSITKHMSEGIDGKPEIINRRSGNHRLPLPSTLVDKFKTYKEEQEAEKKEQVDNHLENFDLIFPNADGGYQNPRTVQRKLKN